VNRGRYNILNITLLLSLSCAGTYSLGGIVRYENFETLDTNVFEVSH